MEKEYLEFTVDRTGERLDKVIVVRLPHLSRSQIQSMIRDGQVLVNEQSVKPGTKLKGGEQIRVILPSFEESVLEPQAIPLNVIYEDNDLAVIDKEAGMIVHPGVGNETGTLVHALLARYPEVANMDDEDGRMGIVHRLDKDTSGLIVIARNLETQEALMRQFKEHEVDKVYLALVERTPKTATGRIDAPIGRDPKNRKRMGVQRNGREAITEFAVVDDHFRDGQALLRIKILTGRTHQIRVHMAFIGCPVVGDQVYGFRKQRIKLKRQFLHATELSFWHPQTGQRMQFISPLPAGLQNVMDKLKVR